MGSFFKTSDVNAVVEAILDTPSELRQHVANVLSDLRSVNLERVPDFPIKEHKDNILCSVESYVTHSQADPYIRYDICLMSRHVVQLTGITRLKFSAFATFMDAVVTYAEGLTSSVRAPEILCEINDDPTFQHFTPNSSTLTAHFTLRTRLSFVNHHLITP